MICLVQLLYYEATQYMKKPKMLNCMDCPFRDKCKDEAKEETDEQRLDERGV